MEANESIIKILSILESRVSTNLTSRIRNLP